MYRDYFLSISLSKPERAGIETPQTPFGAHYSDA
jgi:hypothetical protein